MSYFLKGKPRNCFPVIHITLPKPLVYLIFLFSISSVSVAVFMLLYFAIFGWLYNISLFVPFNNPQLLQCFFIFFFQFWQIFVLTERKGVGKWCSNRNTVFHGRCVPVLVAPVCVLCGRGLLQLACTVLVSPSHLCHWSLSLLNL